MEEVDEQFFLNVISEFCIKFKDSLLISTVT